MELLIFSLIFKTYIIGILVSQSFFLNVSKVWYFLQDTIITDKKVLLLPAINRYYQALVRDIGGEPFRETVISSQKLEIKLNKKYEKQIKIEKGKTTRGNIVYSSLMTSEEALRKYRQQVADKSTQIREVALLLRESIMNAEKARKLNFKRYS